MKPPPDQGQARQEPSPSNLTGNLKLYATAGGLGLLALLLFVHQYTTMARFGVLPPGKRAPTFSDYLAIVSERVEFGLPDYLLLAAIAGLFLALVVVEFRGGCLTALLRGVFTSEGWTIGLLTAAAFAAVRYYLGTGDFPWGGDQPQHICFAQMASRSISEGELPIWTNYLGRGHPVPAVLRLPVLLFHRAGRPALEGCVPVAESGDGGAATPLPEWRCTCWRAP